MDQEFDHADKDKDGTVSKEELREVLQSDEGHHDESLA